MRIAFPLALIGGILLMMLCGACSDDANSPPDPTSCGLSDLPADSGGVHLALPHDPDNAGAAPFGSYIYLPSDMDQSPVAYPLLVFLHGSGERGDSAVDPGALDLVLGNGPPRLIEREEWAPPHPMIVVSPQCHTNWWNADDIRELLIWIDQHYPVDRSHIYLTGLSMGGYGTWSYLGKYGNAAGDSLPVAAAAPICGGGNTNQAAAMADTPIWAFHGTADGTVTPSESVSMIEALGALTPTVPPRLTLYDGAGHDSWSRTYNGDGIGQGLEAYAQAPDVEPWLVPFDLELYTWFFTHER